MASKLGKILLVLWFAFLTSCGSVVVAWQSSGLSRALNQPKAYRLVEGHKEGLLGIGAVVFIGVAAWMLIDSFRRPSPLDDGGGFGNFVYVTYLAVGLGFLVASAALPIVVLAWGFRTFLEEPWAQALAALVVIPLFLYFGRRRKRKPAAAGRPAAPPPPGPNPPLPPGARAFHKKHHRH
jgi:hypothetical protein